MSESLKELEGKGVGLPGWGIQIEEFDNRLRVSLGDASLDVDLVLMGVGVVPNSEIASAAGLDLGPQNSIAVDKTLRTSDPDIFAAGDCADAFHVVTGQRVWIPLALRANRGGWAVADNVTGRHIELPGIAGSAVFKVLDMEVAHAGLSTAEAERAGFDVVDEVVKSRSRAHGHPGNQDIYVHLTADKKSGRLLGGDLVGKEGGSSGRCGGRGIARGNDR
jgi:NADPH-dependent 2,4-dienoyl-CoA reductase/sulfur reductase-like enzyme